jgi:hypothetical protein
MPDLVVSACGPFAERDHGVARAALAAGAHYVDVADARSFVCGIRAIDDTARSRDRLVVSGAGIAPGVTGTVIDAFAHEFDGVSSIDIGVAAAQRAPRGAATVAALANGVGRQFAVWSDGAWRPAHGWQRLRRHRYPREAGTRWLADGDVADLELFPERYQGVRSVTFGAGTMPAIAHLGLWLLSWPVRWRWIGGLDRHADLLRRVGDRLARSASDCAAMHVALEGFRRGRRLSVAWTAVAENGDGAQLPSVAAVVLARKLAAGTLAARGAMPCVGLFSLPEALRALEGFDVRTSVLRLLR